MICKRQLLAVTDLTRLGFCRSRGGEIRGRGSTASDIRREDGVEETGEIRGVVVGEEAVGD